MPDLVTRVSKLPLRKLTAELLRSLSEEQFVSLCNAVYRRNRKQHRSHQHAKALVRRLIVRRKRPQHVRHATRISRALLAARYRDNVILNHLYPERKTQWIPFLRRTQTSQLILENFSFVDNPNNTMQQLHAIAQAESQLVGGTLDFKDTQILDIGPYVVWGLMSEGMAPFVSGGEMDIPVQKVIEAVGLRPFMNMRRFKGLKDRKDVWAFPLRRRNPGQPTATVAKAIGFSLVADKLVETVDEWLDALPVPMTLTDEAKSQFNRIASEILDNAERHGRPGSEKGDWYVAGFMARREVGDDPTTNTTWYDCHIAFVNLGTTIAENILAATQKQIHRDLTNYLSRHSRRRGQSESALATLYAMQDGVSSLPSGAGGQGMMDVVEMANGLGDTDDPNHQPAITVISGRSCIRFTGPYKSYRSSAMDSKRLQCFNPDGTFASPPDRNYVFELDVGFPGTIIALRFSLDYEAMVEKTNATH